LSLPGCAASPSVIVTLYGYGYGGWMFGGGLMMFLWWLLPLALIVGVSFVAFTRHGQVDRAKSALDVLRERYARGEIGKEEFEQKKRDIEG
jgi:putative membrane protein